MTPCTPVADIGAEELWAASDGTVCLLSRSETPPYYVVSLIRNAQVLRERRLYGLASAQMLGQGWRELQVPERRVDSRHLHATGEAVALTDRESVRERG